MRIIIINPQPKGAGGEFGGLSVARECVLKVGPSPLIQTSGQVETLPRLHKFSVKCEIVNIENFKM